MEGRSLAEICAGLDALLKTAVIRYDENMRLEYKVNILALRWHHGTALDVEDLARAYESLWCDRTGDELYSPGDKP